MSEGTVEEDQIADDERRGPGGGAVIELAIGWVTQCPDFLPIVGLQALEDIESIVDGPFRDQDIIACRGDSSQARTAEGRFPEYLRLVW